MEIYTIGFAGKTAEQFFESLKRARVQQLVDVRLNNVSQLAGFTKRSDLPYFLSNLAGIGYRHERLLAPTADLLKAYRRREIAWDRYDIEFRELLVERRANEALTGAGLAERIALLCSESAPDKCHRRAAAEYLQGMWPGATIEHL